MNTLQRAFLRDVTRNFAVFITLGDWPRLERLIAAHSPALLEMGLTPEEAEQYLYDTWRSLHRPEMLPELPRGLWWRRTKRDLAALLGIKTLRHRLQLASGAELDSLAYHKLGLRRAGNPRNYTLEGDDRYRARAIAKYDATR